MKILENEDLGKLLLRVAVGFLMLFHGINKLIGGVGGLEEMFISMGLPSFFAYGAYVGEVMAPLMLVTGYKVRFASIIIIGTMVVAILTAHIGDILSLNKQGAWAIELPMFYILASLSILLLGSGKYVLGNKLK